MFLTLLRRYGKVINCLAMTSLSVLLSLVPAYALDAVHGEQLQGGGLISKRVKPNIGWAVSERGTPHNDMI